MQAIYWDYFRRLIEAHKRDNTAFRYYRSKDGFKDTISICDFELPRRQGTISTGRAESDWYRDSFVCNVTYIEGSVPIGSDIDIWDETANKWVKHPTRGAIQALRILRDSKCLLSSPRLDEFINKGYTANWATP